MICILLGVCPPEDHVWSDIVAKVQSILDNDNDNDNDILQVPVQWIATTQVKDRDRDDTPTQLLTAISEASAESVVAAAGKALGPEFRCEVWASAPAILPLPPPGGYSSEILQVPQQGTKQNRQWLKRQFPVSIRKWGLVLQPAILQAHEIRELRSYVDQEIDATEALIRKHHPNIQIGKDAFHFREISSRGNQRFDLRLQSSQTQEFVNHVIKPLILARVVSVLGGSSTTHHNDRQKETGVDFDVSVVYSKPSAPNQGWHCDGDHLKGANDAGWDSDNGWQTRLAEPYALCVFLPLMDLNDQTGYTQFWPASHRNRDLMGFGKVAEITNATWNGKCAAGDAIWYDYRLFHRGMANTSSVLRPVVQIVVKKKWYVEKVNYGTDSIIPDGNQCVNLTPGYTRD